MALVLNSVLGDETANSYVDVAYADDYFTNHFNSTYGTQWAALSTAKKEQLLIKACADIEQLRFTQYYDPHLYAMHYSRVTRRIIQISDQREPCKYYATQNLQFPRNIDFYTVNAPQGSSLGDIYVPEKVKVAQCEQAIYILNFDWSVLNNKAQGVALETINIGNGQVQVTQEYGADGSNLSPAAVALVKPYLYRVCKTGRG